MAPARLETDLDLEVQGQARAASDPARSRELIRRLSRENRFWGAPRIQAELEHLGHRVAKSTVERYMARRAGPPSPTWREFLRVQADGILACDFFTIPTATFRSVTGFVVMELRRRRILAIDVAANPTAEWAAGVVRRAFLAGGRGARFLIRDRDAIYGAVFSGAMRALGLRQFITAYHAPRMNAHCERLIGTLRRECLDHVIVLGEGHARRLVGDYTAYYNAARSHQALGGDAPEARESQGTTTGRVVGLPVPRGLHHACRRAA